MPLNEIIAEAARKGAEINPCHGKMCNDCAFKLGTDANNEEHTVYSAMDCLVGSGTKFNCHEFNAENNSTADAGRPCAGFLYAKQYYDKMDIELGEKDAADLKHELKKAHDYNFYDQKEQELFEDEPLNESAL